MNPRLIVNKGGNEKLENKIKKQIVWTSMWSSDAQLNDYIKTNLDER